ncbi:helix-turn-helix transcriptional regulator [Streptomyces olivoreticuli]|uniref:helix-turn-helix domain-containing protein n=1 Tax=Streptomyces olivoreticuli TaxID=68246 RepID=UPI002657C57F|nr:helix-turn-helix transcriptional regulator [Streptomyces olivoreticuli]WKK25905.1 helix-turn-helix transcriptional regulator [Streptomyces olivoreticuli]
MSSSSPSSSVAAARKALADRLVEIRKDAGITGEELSARCGWHAAKTSRIQSGKAAPTDADLRAWCAACGAEEQAADLIATARAADSMYVEWRRRHRTGLRHAQEQLISGYEKTSLFRIYVSNVIPGFFQTPEYATALMQSITEFHGTPDDVAEAVPARMARSRLIYEGGHRFAVLIEEWVLRSQIGEPETMAGQLRHLLSLMPLASVSLGVIPSTARRTVWPLEAFYLFDDRRVAVENLTAKINVVQPRDIADYAKAFIELSGMAVYGARARTLITAAIEALG